MTSPIGGGHLMGYSMSPNGGRLKSLKCTNKRKLNHFPEAKEENPKTLVFLNNLPKFNINFNTQIVLIFNLQLNFANLKLKHTINFVVISFNFAAN